MINTKHLQGGQYLVSWRNGCNSFTASEAAAYCSSNGIFNIQLGQLVILNTAQAMVRYDLVTRVGCVYIWKIGMSAVSLDTPEKEREFGGLLTRYTLLSTKI